MVGGERAGGVRALLGLSDCQACAHTNRTMSKTSFFARMFGLPLLAVLIFLGFLTPRYVPSDSLVSAAGSTPSPELGQARMIASFVGRCRSNWNFDRFRLRGEASLYSWENDAGLLARTRIVCLPGQRCSVTAQALITWPFPSKAGGKPLPTRIWGCRSNTPDWTRPTTLNSTSRERFEVGGSGMSAPEHERTMS